VPDAITDQPECASCGGACCQPERLEFPVPEGETLSQTLIRMLGFGDILGVRVNEHGRTVVRLDCWRRDDCKEVTRPIPCLRFPLSYLDADHSDAERAEVAEFCALFRRLQEEVKS